MNKKLILFFAIIFGLGGNFLPMLFGDNDLFSIWAVLSGLAGGIFGVWLGVIVSKRIG